MEDDPTSNKATNVELEVTRLGTLGVLSGELRKLGLTREHEEKYENQGDNMA